MACISPCSTCHVPFKSSDPSRFLGLAGAAITEAALLRRRYLTTRAPGLALMTRGSPCSISSLPLKLVGSAGIEVGDLVPCRGVDSAQVEGGCRLLGPFTAKRLDDPVSLLGSIELPGEPVLLVAAVVVSEDRSRPGSRARSVATRR